MRSSDAGSPFRLLPAGDRPIFSAAGRDYQSSDIVRAAHFRGELQSVSRHLRDALSCQVFATEEGYRVDDALLQEASDQYRILLNLTTAAATEQWLQLMGLTVDDFSDYLERHYWRNRFHRDIEEVSRDYDPEQETLDTNFWAELVLSGRLETMARELAKRVALDLEAGGQNPSERAIREARAEFFRIHAVDPEDLDKWLSKANCSPEAFQELLNLEAHFQEMADRHLTEKRYEAALSGRRMELTRIELLTANFGSAEVAHEVFLSAAADGGDFSSICRRAGTEPGHIITFLDSFPRHLRLILFCACDGETLQPSKHDDTFCVYHVVRKLEPQSTCPEVRQRIRVPLLEPHFCALVEKYISWSIPLKWNQQKQGLTPSTSPAHEQHSGCLL